MEPDNTKAVPLLADKTPLTVKMLENLLDYWGITVVLFPSFL